MLQVKNLKKTYGAFSLDVSLEVQEGSDRTEWGKARFLRRSLG